MAPPKNPTSRASAAPSAATSSARISASGSLAPHPEASTANAKGMPQAFMAAIVECLSPQEHDAVPHLYTGLRYQFERSVGCLGLQLAGSPSSAAFAFLSAARIRHTPAARIRT